MVLWTFDDHQKMFIDRVNRFENRFDLLRIIFFFRDVSVKSVEIHWVSTVVHLVLVERLFSVMVTKVHCICGKLKKFVMNFL